MSRIIKFRAWDGKRMLYGITQWYIGETDGKYHLVDGYTLETLMQFTGLLDKNGKDIYEGDILLFWKGFNETYREYTGEVKWHQQAGSWYVLCGKFYQDIVGFAQSGDGEKVNLDNAEIIGNIYETPSLIKPK